MKTRTHTTTFPDSQRLAIINNVGTTTPLWPKFLRNRLRDLATIGIGTIVSGVFASPAFADPVPIPIEVFCFRFTDIKQSEADPEGNRFEFEFESLNWTNMPAQGVYMALNEGTGLGGVEGEAPFLDGVGIDENGRPLPGVDIDGNPINESMRPPGNQDIPNNWEVKSLPDEEDKFTKSAVRWSTGTNGNPIDNVDLIGITNALGNNPSPQDIVDEVNKQFSSFEPDFNPRFLEPDVNPQEDRETVDNGPNVLDGFVFALDDFDVGEIVSLNWFLEDDSEEPIGTPNGGNGFGFGTINIIRINPGDPIPETSVLTSNTGFNQSETIVFDDIFQVKDEEGNIVAEFAFEFGAAITSPFLDPSNNIFNVQPNVRVTPEPLTILGSATAVGFGTLFKKKVSQRKRKKSN